MRTRHVIGRWALAAALVAVVVGVAPGAGAPSAALSPIAPDHAWVAAAYRKTLDREPTSAQLRHRLGQLEAGTSRRTITDELTGSAEHAGVVIDRLYRRVLGRPVDTTSRAYWVGRLTRGERVSTAASHLYGSPELFAAAGSTAEGYVTFLYRDVLGREPDAAGLAYWAARIDAGENRTGLARQWLLSPEATGLQAGLVFLEVLQRQPTGSQRADWAARLRRLDLRRITSALLASDEAYALGSSEQTRLTASAASSGSPSISADGRIVAFASRAWDLTPAGSPPGDDIFVFDRRTGRMRAITAGNGASMVPEVSADGTTVVFQSDATNLVPGDTNRRTDIFRASTAGGPIEQITEGNASSTEPVISGDGTVVAFSSLATDLVIGAGGQGDVFVHTDGQPLRALGEAGAGAPALAADGSALVFHAGPPLGGAPLQAYRVALPLAPDPAPLQVSTEQGRDPSISADGDRVAYLGDPSDPDGVVADVHVVDVDGTSFAPVRTLPGSRPRLSDDGGSVLSVVGTNGGVGSFVVYVDFVYPTDGGPRSGPFGFEGDLSADGRTVVVRHLGGEPGQIALFALR